jgi:hypothetical protein
LDPILRQTGINIEQMGKKLKLVQMYKEKNRHWADTGKEIDFDAEICTFDKLVGKGKEPVEYPIQKKISLHSNLTDPDMEVNHSPKAKPSTIDDDNLGESDERMDDGQSPLSRASLLRKNTADIEPNNSGRKPKVKNLDGNEGGPGDGSGGNWGEPSADKESD